MSITLELNYFYINGIFIHQIKNLQKGENNVILNICYKSANSFNYSAYKSCHPPHTENNISLSLAKSIVSIVTNNTKNQLKKLKEHLLDTKNPHLNIDYSFTKIFQPKFQTKNNHNNKFIRTCNPNHNINLKKLHSCLDRFKSEEPKTISQKIKI